MQYSILIGLLILGELALVGYVVAVQDQVSYIKLSIVYTRQSLLGSHILQAYAGFELILRNDIENYYNDVSTRDVLDLIQSEVS